MTILTQRFHDLGPVTRIPPGEGRTFQVGDTLIAVFRTRTNEVYATRALCPHRSGTLADGVIGAGQVVCPLHAYRFDLATGQPIGNDCPALQTYPVTINGIGHITLRLEDGADWEGDGHAGG